MICIKQQISVIIKITIWSSFLFKTHANVEISQNINEHLETYKGNATFGMCQSFSVGMRICKYSFLKAYQQRDLKSDVRSSMTVNFYM